MKSEIIVNLENPIKYSSGGQSIDATFITMTAPTAKNIVECGQIKRMVTKAAFEASKMSNNDADAKDEKDDDDDDAEIKTSGILEMIYAFSSNEDISSAIIASKIIFKNVGLVDGEIGLTLPLMDSLSAVDFETMFGEYIKNFIAASMFNPKREKK